MNIDIDHKKGVFSASCRLQTHAGISALYGPSGAGKTTLLRVIAGLETPQRGKISLNARVLFDDRRKINVPPHRRRIGFVFQEGRLFPHLTVEKNLRFGCRRTGPASIVLEEITSLLGLGNLLQQKPFRLSGGEKQRVAIGRALLSSPEMLLLDEPFSNLDAAMRRDIINYLLRIHHRFNIPMIAVSHNLSDLLRLTQDLILIADGKIAAHDNYYKLMASSDTRILPDAAEHLNIFDLQAASLSDDGLVCFSLPHHPQNVIKIQAAKPIGGGARVRLSLRPEDIALAAGPVENISIQNHLTCTIRKLAPGTDRVFCLLDCGIPLLCEVTTAAVKKLRLKEGSRVFCLFKAKAVQVVTTFP